MKIKLRYQILIGITLLLTACDPLCDKYHDFVRLPVRVQADTLSSFPPEEQVEMYLATQYCLHPPAPLYRDLAKAGEAVLPAILSRLEETDSDAERMPLLRVLGTMSCEYYDLSENARAITISEGAVERLGPDRRSYGREYMLEIRREACPGNSRGPL